MRPGRCILLAALALAAASPLSAADRMDFWEHPRHGANSFNEAIPDQAYFDALAATGATWVRLTFSKWHGEGRDFLIGNADRYEGIPERDLEQLKLALDCADAAGLKVVVVPLSLPGARWIQQNGEHADERLWSDFAYWDQAARFWTDLAAALKDHPAVAAYNLLNEPYPERPAGLAVKDTQSTISAWEHEQRGTSRDLAAFYEKLVAAVRSVDPVTPIMVDAGMYAGAQRLTAWDAPLADSRVLYAVHMYVPWQATSRSNQEAGFIRRYPGFEAPYDGRRQVWDRAAVKAHLALAFDWAEAHGLPPNRIVVSEFGCVRRWGDCGTYLDDVISAADARGGHWAFYAFRPDEWDGMDYELPATVTPEQYYWRREQGTMDTLPRDGALMDLLRIRLRGESPDGP